MKKRKSILLSAVLGALLLSVSSGAVLVAHTVSAYTGACDKLTGFPGMLQSAGFIPIGNCRQNIIARRCPTNNCTVDGKRGHCVLDQIAGRDVCVCVPDRISR